MLQVKWWENYWFSRSKIMRAWNGNFIMFCFDVACTVEFMFNFIHPNTPVSLDIEFVCNNDSEPELDCTMVQHIVLHRFANWQLQCTAALTGLHWISPDCTKFGGMPYAALYCIIRNCTTPHCIALRCLTWHDVPWREVTWGDVRCRWRDMTWRDVTWRGVTWRDVTWHDMTWHDMTWHDMTWHDMTWHDMTWHDMTWHDMTWHVD